MLSSDNVRRARLAYSNALEALKLGNLEDAAEAADEMCYLLALSRIIDPLVEIDNAGKLVSVQIKVILSIPKSFTFNLFLYLSLFLNFSCTSSITIYYHSSFTTGILNKNY